MSELFKICIHHGELKKEDIGLHSHTQRQKIRLYCKICSKIRQKNKRLLINQMKKNNPEFFNSKKILTCVNHGVLLQKDISIDGYGEPRCKFCLKEQKSLRQIGYRIKDPLFDRRSNIKRKYKITLEQYDVMAKEQDNKCYICKQPETLMRRGVIPPLSIDHCHDSEKLGIVKIRKLLCRKCNSALALLREDYAISIEMTKYIDEICNKKPQ